MNEGLGSMIRAANAELLEAGDPGAIPRFFSADYVAHLTDGAQRGGHGFVRSFVEQLHSAFGDVEVEVEVLLENQDRVAWQRTVRAIHRGTFAGFPGTDRPVTWRDMIVSRIEDGLVAEEWVSSDLAERLLRARGGRG